MRVLLLLALACRNGGGTTDVGPFDSAIFDAEEREAGAVDARPDGWVALDMAVEDGGDLDAGLRDAGGQTCESPIRWSDLKVPLVDTTEASDHRERFSCSGVGAGATSPERWAVLALEEPTHVIFRLGTDGWDGVLSVRTATCGESGEVACVDEPPVVELPSATGIVYLGVEGFARGAGSYVLSSFSGESLAIPPANAICALAPVVALPMRISTHNFGADPSSIAGCDLGSPVFFPIEIGAMDVLSVRVEPRSEGDVALALIDDCGAVVACSSAGGHGVAEVLDDVSVSPGRYAIVAGSSPAGRTQSFFASARLGPGCVKASDCAIGEVCGESLECLPIGGAATVLGPIPIPDDGEVTVPIPVVIPVERPSVRVRVVLDHPYPADLVVELAGPGGRPIVRLRDRLDGALDSVYGKDRPADGPGSLFDFHLVATASGAWALRVRDRALGDEGSVAGVVLEVE